MRKIITLNIFLFVIKILTAQQDPSLAMFQTSTINALMQGYCRGEMTISELKKHGDFGIGTFNSFDGEMIGLDNQFYQVKSDGYAYPAYDSMKIPFADVVFFRKDTIISLKNIKGLAQLESEIDSLLPSKNIIYAFKMKGNFNYIKARSVPKQNNPQASLAEAARNQTIFEYSNVKGTLVGFRMPDYFDGINVPRFHMHYISDDKQTGGHLLDCTIKDVQIEIDFISDINLNLPRDAGFMELNLQKTDLQQLNKIEK